MVGYPVVKDSYIRAYSILKTLQFYKLETLGCHRRRLTTRCKNPFGMQVTALGTKLLGTLAVGNLRQEL